MESVWNQQHLEQIYFSAIEAVQPSSLLPRVLKVSGKNIQLGEEIFSSDNFNNIFIAGAGKATAAMAVEVEKALNYSIADGVIAVKTGHHLPLKFIRAFEAGHPLPDENSVSAANELIAMLGKVRPRDLVIYLLSGGASSLLTDLPYGCTLKEIYQLNQLLLNSGADINEINTVRKHLSSLKGGQSLRITGKALVVNFMISDVIGDDMSVIGSGPTFPDPTTFADALEILKKYELDSRLTPSILNHFNKGIDGQIDETLKPGDEHFKHARNYIIGSNKIAILAAQEKAIELGYTTQILDNVLTGDSSSSAVNILNHAKNIREKGKYCLIAGGETTMKVAGTGKGGRNQHLALKAAIAMQGIQHISLLSAGTDGTDGPTDAAGAMVDGDTYTRAISIGSSPEKYLEDFNSYHFFEKTGGHLKPGPTQTNVMDLTITLINNE